MSPYLECAQAVDLHIDRVSDLEHLSSAVVPMNISGCFRLPGGIHFGRLGNYCASPMRN